MARRAPEPELLDQVRRGRQARRPAARHHRRAGRRPRHASTSCPSRSASCVAPATRPRPRHWPAESRSLGEREKQLADEHDAVGRRAARAAAGDPQPAPSRRPRRRLRRRQPGRPRTVRAPRWRRVPRAPARTALGDRRGARHPRQRAGDEDQRLDVHDDPRARGDDGAGAVPARPRPQRRCVRGDPPTVARHHGDAHGDRSPAEVRRRRLCHRARRAVGDPDRRGAVDVDLRRRDPRPRPSCRSG